MGSHPQTFLFYVFKTGRQVESFVEDKEERVTSLEVPY